MASYIISANNAKKLKESLEEHGMQSRKEGGAMVMVGRDGKDVMRIEPFADGSMMRIGQGNVSVLCHEVSLSLVRNSSDRGVMQCYVGEFLVGSVDLSQQFK